MGGWGVSVDDRCVAKSWQYTAGSGPSFLSRPEIF